VGRKKREQRDGISLSDLRWALTDAEHRAYRKHLGRSARWPLTIRIALAILIAGLMTWSLVLVVGYGVIAVAVGCLVGLIVLLGTVIYGGKEPKVLPACAVALTPEGYQSGGAKGSWAQFGGITQATVIEHPGGVLVMRVVGPNGWADFPLATASRSQADRFCQALLDSFSAT
jgi:hypothetical protein